MPAVLLDSTLLASALYDSATRRLNLEFRTGEHYLYFQVPLDCFQQLIAAESKGAYFNLHIRNCFPFQRLSPPTAPVVLPARPKTK